MIITALKAKLTAQTVPDLELQISRQQFGLLLEAMGEVDPAKISDNACLQELLDNMKMLNDAIKGKRKPIFSEYHQDHGSIYGDWYDPDPSNR